MNPPWTKVITVALGTDFAYFASLRKPAIVEIPIPTAEKPAQFIANTATRQNCLADFPTAVAFIKKQLEPYRRGWLRLRPRVIVSGGFSNEAERRYIRDVFFAVRVRDFFTLNATFAAAIGAGLPIEKSDPCPVLIVERNWMEYAVISKRDAITRFALAWGADDLLENIAIYLAKTQQSGLDMEVLRQRIRLLGFSPVAQLADQTIWTDDVTRGRMSSKNADAEMNTLAASPVFIRLVYQIRKSHEILSGEQKQQTEAAPLQLFGEYAETPGFAALLSQLLGVRVLVAPDARLSMIKGTLNVAHQLDQWVADRPK